MNGEGGMYGSLEDGALAIYPETLSEDNTNEGEVETLAANGATTVLSHASWQQVLSRRHSRM